MPLTPDVAKKFLGGLYDRQHLPDLRYFDAAATRLVASVEHAGVPVKDVTGADKALELLMFHHVVH